MAKRVLVVDDNSEDLLTIKSALEGSGCNVTTATSGKSALQLVTKNSFAVIIVDILMPSLSGYELVRLLREKVKKNVRIIFASVVPGNEVEMFGVDGFIQKPFELKELVSAVEKYLG